MKSNTQNAKIEAITEKTLVLGIDVGSETHYTSMDGMTAAEKTNIISTIFNKTDLAAVNSLLANTGDTWDDLQQSI